MLVTGIGRLVTNEPELGEGPLGVIRDAALVVDGGRIAWVGARRATPEGAGTERIDLDGRCAIPGFVDAHTHLVFAGDRAAEFEARLGGAGYDGGGIMDTVAATRGADAQSLSAAAAHLAREALSSGTTTLEVKSGYGLTVVDERRLLEIAAGLGRAAGAAVEPTFLGAHVVPSEFNGDTDGYVDLVVSDMLEECAPLARWCDVFCEPTVFDQDHARAVLTAGRAMGLGLRLHANQLEHGPGALLAAELSAVSADHLTHLDDRDVTALADAGVVATLLPAAEFSTRAPPAPARRLLEAGAIVALATDCNPGTSYTTSMPFVVALACLRLAMSPDEAVWSATRGGALALARDDVGRLAPGAVADLVAIDADHHVHLAYRAGVNLIHTVLRAGRPVDGERHRG